MVPGFSFFATLAAGLGALSVRRLSWRWIVPWFLGGVAVVWIGMATDSGVLTSAGLVGASATLGAILGRLLPPRSGPVLLILIVLAGLDLAWIASGGVVAEGWLEKVANLTIEFGESTSSIGTIDLVVAAALTSHWLTRRAIPWLALAPGPIGMVFSNLYVAVTGRTNLALIPFLLLGWLTTEGLERRFGIAGSEGQDDAVAHRPQV